MEAAGEPRVVGDPYEGPVVAEPGAAAAGWRALWLALV